jgi:hypothetical protein
MTAGCPGSRRSAQVNGKVTANGQPLAEVAVVFEPVGSGAGRGSSGTTDASGSYSLRFVDNNEPGALIGRHQVTFRDLKASSEGADAGGLPKQQFRFPTKYMNEPQEFEVKAGANQADFDLK